MDFRAWLLGALALPWFVQAAVIGLSLFGARPLAGRVLPLSILGCAFAATLFIMLRATQRRPTFTPAQPLPHALETVLATLWVSALAVSAAGLLFAMLLPIVAYDALWYRVPAIAQWLDAGRISWVTSDDPYRNGYPLGQEAVSAVAAAATDSFRFAGATSFAYVIAGALSLRALCESCGVRPAIARAAAGLFLLAPMTILNAGSGYVDAAFAGATIALLCNAARLASSAESGKQLGLATGMSACHVLALKGTGLGFVALVGFALMCRFWFERRRGRSLNKSTLALAVLLALPGTFFVTRNLTHTGNPFWPVEIRLAGHTLFHGVGTMDDILDIKSNTPAELVALPPFARVVHNWLQLHGPAVVFDDRAAGLGWAFALFGVPAVALICVRAMRRRRVSAGALFVIALSVACFALQPMAWWARYTLWLWGAAALAIALEAEHLAACRRFVRLELAALTISALCLGEAAVAAAHADGAALAVQRWLAFDAPELGALSDPRRALNTQYWPAPEFFALGLERRGDVCRGSFKPDTDDAIVDGVLAQFNPRPRMHIIDDDKGDWPRVRNAWRAAGCAELLLLRGSPVLDRAGRDPSVRIEVKRAFDPLFVVRSNELAQRDGR